jgi:hypothetical protein
VHTESTVFLNLNLQIDLAVVPPAELFVVHGCPSKYLAELLKLI